MVCEAHLSRMAKREVRKFFHFCVFIAIDVFKNQEDCPNYLALKDHSILTNQKCLEEIFFKLCFKKRAIGTPGSGDTPYIMALYGAGGSALKGYYFKYMKKYRDFTS